MKTATEEDVSEVISGLDSELSRMEEPDFYSLLEKRSEESLEDKENKGIIGMRKMWAIWILVFIGLIIVFDIILVAFYGLEIWKFNNPLVVIVIITENFFKIIGLGAIIAFSLFKKIF